MSEMKKIELSGKGKGNFILIDDEDFELVSSYKWYFAVLNFQD